MVLKVEVRGLRVAAEHEDAWVCRGRCGRESWNDLVEYTLDHGMPGLENLARIPGTVGAAPVQNIGAYGVELAERFESLDAVDLVTGRQRRARPGVLRLRLPRQRVQARARRPQPHHAGALSPAAAPWQPVLGYLELQKKIAETGIAAPDAQQIHDWIASIRAAKLPDPAAIGNAGSFFKNPVVTPEQCRDIHRPATRRSSITRCQTAASSWRPRG